MSDGEGCFATIFAAALFIGGLILGFITCPHERIYNMAQGQIIKKTNESGQLCVLVLEDDKIQKYYITKHDYINISEDQKYHFSKRERNIDSIGDFVEINIVEEVK